MSEPAKDLLWALYRENRGKAWGLGAGLLAGLIGGFLGWKILLLLILGAAGFLVGKYVDDRKKMEGPEDEKDQTLP
jgi:uncharacterized membrane protein